MLRWPLAALVLCGSWCHGADLATSQITLKGRVQLQNVGGSCEGLAYNPLTNTWFVVSKSGNHPFTIVELKFDAAQLSPATVIKSTLVRTWGDVNTGTPTPFPSTGLPNMKGLLYHEGQLVLNGGSYYASGVNHPVIGVYDLDLSKTNRLQGPWMVDPAISSERVKGMFVFAPPIIAQQTQQPLISVNYRGATAQVAPWGLGLVSLSMPDVSCPPNSHVPARVISFWPMKLLSNGVQFSDYPRSGVATRYLQTGANGVVTATDMTNKFNVGDLLQSGVFVGDTLVVFGRLGSGHQWYGNPDDYLNTPSMLDPTQPTRSIFAGRGVHKEAEVDYYWLVSGATIATKFKAGDQLVSHYASGRVSDLGVPLQTKSFGQPVWLPEQRLLVVINHGTGNSAAPMPMLVVLEVAAN